MSERPASTLDKVKRALTRDRALPPGEVAAKAVRFAMAIAIAPVYLRDCDEVGSRVRTVGRPSIQNLGRMTLGRDGIINSTPFAVRLSTSPRGEIAIGRHFIFNYGASIASDARIELGDRVTLGPYARVCDYEGEPAGGPAPVVLEDDVWLTIRVTVKKGVRIGAGTIVTAGSVVTEDLPAHVIAGGVPARVIKPRDPKGASEAPENGPPSRLHGLARLAGGAIDATVGRARLHGADSVGADPSVRGHTRIHNLGTLAIGSRFRLQSSPEESHLVTGPRGRLLIGDDVSIASGAAIDAEERIEIGHRVSIGEVAMIMDTNFHGTDDFMGASTTSPVVIGDDAVIGSHVTILKGSTIGRGARIAPHSVVSGNIPAGTYAAGVIARVIAGG
ncbi:MAG TPA: acyltransferase [Polyangiaceae bacterium]|jgi:maltose O-acetyltransferase